jgi:hypothetical protein
MAYLYRHIRLDKNEPFYIGVGSSANYFRAFRKTNRNNHWNNVVNITNYEVEILFDDLSDEQARLKEIEFIKLYGRVDLGTGSLVNLTDGGDGCLSRKMTKEIASKIGNANKGKIRTKEFRDNIALVNKARMSNPEIYEKHCKSTKNNRIPIRYNTPKKPVLQYDLNNNLIKEHDSITSASIQFNSNKLGLISRCCNNKQKTALGYIWKFKSIDCS